MLVILALLLRMDEGCLDSFRFDMFLSVEFSDSNLSLTFSSLSFTSKSSPFRLSNRFSLKYEGGAFLTIDLQLAITYPVSPELTGISLE
jgi:hypothetical protein